MKKIVGFMLIGLSIIIGFSSVLNIFPNGIALLLVLVCVSVPLYLLGHLLRTNRKMMKVKWKLWMSAYLFIIIIIPTLLYTITNYEELKELTFSSEQFILFDSTSANSLKGFSVVFVISLLVLISIRLFSADIQRKWIVNLLISMTVLIYVCFQYIMWDDYRGIHETEGLVNHKWNGDEYSIPWHEVEEVTVTPYIKYADLNRPDDDTHISWKMTFTAQNGEVIVYRFSSLYEEPLQKGNRVKEIATARHIPFKVSTMSEKERKWYELELELNELQREPFDVFFEVQ